MISWPFASRRTPLSLLLALVAFAFAAPARAEKGKLGSG